MWLLHHSGSLELKAMGALGSFKSQLASAVLKASDSAGPPEAFAQELSHTRSSTVHPSRPFACVADRCPLTED